jgi:hypothetical protein
VDGKPTSRAAGSGRGTDAVTQVSLDVVIGAAGEDDFLVTTTSSRPLFQYTEAKDVNGGDEPHSSPDGRTPGVYSLMREEHS